MKTTKFIIAALAAAAATSCASTLESNDPAANSDNVITEITANFPDSKTILQSDSKVFWEVGDAINLFYNKEGSKFTSTLTKAEAVSKFSGSLNVLFGSTADESEEKGGLTGNGDYLWGVYPYNEANTSDGSSVTAVLPNIQVAREGSFAKDAFLTVGKSETPVMGFYAACGAIKFQLSRSDIKTVTLKGNKNEAVAGKVKIQFTEGLPTTSISSSGAQTAITLEAPEGETFASGKDYLIAAAPVKFEEGFELIFLTSDNKVGTLKSVKANEIKRAVISNLGTVDTGIEFVQKNWSAATVIPYSAGTLAFDINPVTKKPELAIVQNLSGSKGPVLYFTDLNAAPVTVTPEDKTNCQYIALGINASGKSYIFTHDATTSVKLGSIYSSADKTSWNAEITDIPATNAYYGNTIGCLGNQVLMMTCNNAKGTLARRAVNITKYDGSSWSYDNALPNSVTGATGYYFPVVRAFGDKLYTFVTNVGKGLTITSYDGTSFTEIAALSTADEAYAKFGYNIYEHQDMVVAPDGQFWFAISTKTPYSHIIAKFNPDDKSFTQIASAISTTNSISARSCRIGLNPVTEDVYIVYRNDDQCLCVSKLDDETFDKWGAAEQLTYDTASDVEVRFSADGKGYIVCTTGGHVEVFTLL